MIFVKNVIHWLSWFRSVRCRLPRMNMAISMLICPMTSYRRRTRCKILWLMNYLGSIMIFNKLTISWRVRGWEWLMKICISIRIIRTRMISTIIWARWRLGKNSRMIRCLLMVSKMAKVIDTNIIYHFSKFADTLFWRWRIFFWWCWFRLHCV
jgi:hypothetical protein